MRSRLYWAFLGHLQGGGGGEGVTRKTEINAPNSLLGSLGLSLTMPPLYCGDQASFDSSNGLCLPQLLERLGSVRPQLSFLQLCVPRQVASPL